MRNSVYLSHPFDLDGFDEELDLFAEELTDSHHYARPHQLFFFDSVRLWCLFLF